MTVSTENPGLFRRLKQRRERGLALFDVILAVGVIGFLIAGGVLLLQTVTERIKRNDTVSLVNQMRAEAQRIFAGQPTFTGLNMTAFETRGSLPDYVIRAGTAAPTPAPATGVQAASNRWLSAYDGQVGVWPQTGVKQFTIGIGGLDNGPCVDIMTPYTLKTRTASGLVAMGTATASTPGTLATVAWTSTWAPATGGRGAVSGAGIPLATAQSWCIAGDGLNQVYFRFQG